MRFIIFICFILISCAENETFDTGVGIKLEDNSGLLLERTANTVNVNSTANNEFFETSKSGFIDFSELNPFSEGTDW